MIFTSPTAPGPTEDTLPTPELSAQAREEALPVSHWLLAMRLKHPDLNGTPFATTAEDECRNTLSAQP
jgi:hypothetical protein